MRGNMLGAVVLAIAVLVPIAPATAGTAVPGGRIAFTDAFGGSGLHAIAPDGQGRGTCVGGAVLHAGLTDDFNDGTIDTARWSDAWHVAETGGQLTFQLDSDSSEIFSANRHTIRDSSLTFEVAFDDLSIGTDSLFAVRSARGPTRQAYFTIHDFGSGDRLAWGHYDGAFRSLGDIAYSPKDHRWLRLRGSGGTFHWETSPDRSDWKVQDSEPTSLFADWSVADVRVYFMAANWEVGPPTSNRARLHHVDIVPATTTVTPDRADGWYATAAARAIESVRAQLSQGLLWVQSQPRVGTAKQCVQGPKYCRWCRTHALHRETR